jgi:hypothetical protein
MTVQNETLHSLYLLLLAQQYTIWLTREYRRSFIMGRAYMRERSIHIVSVEEPGGK